MRSRRPCRTLVGVLLMAPLVLVGPALVLLEAVLALGGHGPLGWLAAAALVAAVTVASWWSVRAALRWWASTKAPEQPPTPTRASPW